MNAATSARLIERACRPPAVAYALTPLGESLAPILAAISRWGFGNIVDPARAG